MARFILPNDDLALALREPSLLVPGKKPVSAVTINYRNPIARGLKHYFLLSPSEPYRCLVTGIQGTNNGTTFVGDNIDFDGGSDYIAYSTDQLTLTGDAAFSILTELDIDAIPASFNGILEIRYTNGANSSNLFVSNNPAYRPFSFRAIDSGSSKVDSRPSGGATPSGKNFVAVTHNGDFVDAADFRWYVNSTKENGIATAAGTLSQNESQIGRYASGNEFDGRIKYIAIFDRQLSDVEVESVRRDPYQLLKPANQSPFLIGAAAAGGITGTGSLAAQASAISGAGTLGRTGTGALSAQASAIAGTGEITHTGTGALASQASAIAGVGALAGAISGTGALAAGASTIAGIGELTHTGTGALASQVSVVDGAGTTTPAGAITGTGDLDAQASSLAGAGEVTHTAVGALIAQSSIIVGAGTLTRKGIGALAAQAAAVAGTGELFELITGTGALASQASTIAGAGSIPALITGTGALVAGSSSISGSDSQLWTEIPSVTTVWTEI